jgi:MFS transporter, DHA2 family, multidrug resistance protein
MTELTFSASLGRPTRILILLVVTLVTCMEFLTNYAVSVALPDIQGDLAASFDEGSWILTAYTTFFLLGLVVSNALTDRIGYRTYMLITASVFALAAAGCGLSHTLGEMLVFRCIMGFAGGSFLARAQTAIYRLYPIPVQTKPLIFFVLCVVGIARTCGPMVGGYLTEWYSWRAIFFLNIPFALTTIAILVLCLPNLRTKMVRKYPDWLGMLLLACWIVPIQIVLSRGERDDWFADPFIQWLTAAAVLCLPLFIWWELREGNRTPVISLRTYATRSFVVGSIYDLVLGMMLYGQLYAVPQFLRNVQQHSSWETGVLQSFNGAAFFVGIAVGAVLMKSIGNRLALAGGAAVFCVGMLTWATRLSIGISDEAMLLPLALTGLGAGWQVGPLSTLIKSETPPVLLGECMELYLFQRQLGGNWGIALLTILVDRRRSLWSERLGEGVSKYNLAFQEQLRAGARVLHATGLPFDQAQGVSLGLIHGRLLVQSIVNAFTDTFYYQAVLAVIALVLIFAFSHLHHLKLAWRWSADLIHSTR